MPRFKTMSAKTYDPSLKVRLQNTGRLGFGDDTARGLELSTDTYMKFDIDEDSADTLLYMTVLRQANADAFQVKKAGSYFYLSTSRMFDSLDVDYKNMCYIYDLVRCTKYDDVLGGEVYRMDRRTTSKSKSKGEDDGEEDIEEG